MYYEVYMDVFFVVNLLVDFMVLCIANHIFRGTANPLKSFAGAVLGAGGMCIFFLFGGEIHVVKLVVFYCVMVCVMVCVGCSVKSLRELPPAILVFQGTALLFGGFFTVVPDIARRGIFAFFAITVMIYWLIYIGIRLCRCLKGKRTVQCDVSVALNQKEMKVKGLYDTGNCLRDKATGKPVCVMEYSSFSRLLDRRQQEALEQFCSMEEVDSSLVKEELLGRLNPRFLLYSSVGCQRGLLPVVTADSLTVMSGEKIKKIQNAAIGLSKTALSPCGNFQIIISPMILDS